jgi:hypothetical protein
MDELLGITIYFAQDEHRQGGILEKYGVVGIYDTANALGDGFVSICQGVEYLGEDGLYDAAEYGLKHLLLGAKIVVQGGTIDVCSGGDLAHASFGKTLFDEDFSRDVDDLIFHVAFLSVCL